MYTVQLTFSFFFFFFFIFFIVVIVITTALPPATVATQVSIPFSDAEEGKVYMQPVRVCTAAAVAPQLL